MKSLNLRFPTKQISVESFFHVYIYAYQYMKTIHTDRHGQIEIYIFIKLRVRRIYSYI